MILWLMVCSLWSAKLVTVVLTRSLGTSWSSIRMVEEERNWGGSRKAISAETRKTVAAVTAMLALRRFTMSR